MIHWKNRILLALLAATVLVGCDPMWTYKIKAVSGDEQHKAPSPVSQAKVLLYCPGIEKRKIRANRIEKQYFTGDEHGNVSFSGLGWGYPTNCTITVSKEGFVSQTFRVQDFCDEKKGDICRYVNIEAKLEKEPPGQDLVEPG